MDVDVDVVSRLLVAVLGAAAIGVERQWLGHASGAQARLGGIRTFTLLGGLAGLSGWFAVSDLLHVSVVLLAAAAGIIVAGYCVASRRDIDATTEVAALVVLGAGALAGAGHIVLASAVSTATALLLLEKTRLHALVMGIDDAVLRASVQFAAMACVILPLLPAGPYGPLDAIRPRELWALVLFFSGLSFAGWIARRIVGPQRGVIVAGVLGGLVSSTWVTTSFARDSRSESAPRLALGLGVVAACTVMLVRVAVACTVLNPSLARAMVVPYLGLAFVIGVIVVLTVGWANPAAPESKAEPESPLQLRAALQMTGLFQVVLFVILAVQARWSAQALVATSVLVGATDVDALTLSLARSTTGPESLAIGATALAAGVLANTALKLVIALLIGRGAFQAVTVLTLSAMAAAIAGALMVL
jgi:uncharacterized membrane protein (DUF4010 family)